MSARSLLVVDDDPATRLLLRVFFEKKGYAVKEAGDGDEGLALAPSVDVVLLDQMMPGKTGVEVVQLLRGQGCQVPVLMLTADSAAETAVAAIDAGADDHVTKPFSLPVLFAHVERRLRTIVDDDPEIVDVDDADPHGQQLIVAAPPADAPAEAASWLSRLKGLSKKLMGEPPPTLAPGSLLGGRYRLDAVIGAGKMGAVWRARHVDLDVDVAVKVLHRDTRPLQPGETARDSFRREGLMLARVRHPNVVRALDAGVDASGHAFLVMELLVGETLRVTMARDGGLPVQQACGIAADVCAALSACHREGVVHRDVKAMNVFLDTHDPDDGRVTKLIDLGAACAIDDVRQHDLLVGTPSHMAPERFTDPRATPASDIYAAGVLLHHLLTGALPFVAADVEALAQLHQTQKPPSPSSLVPTLPAGVDDTVKRLLRKSPADRPSAREACLLLRSIARSQHEKEKRKKKP
jgi:CheY-like chemotaxis protein